MYTMNCMLLDSLDKIISPIDEQVLTNSKNIYDKRNTDKRQNTILHPFQT